MRRATKAVKEKVFELYDAGSLTNKEIARQVGFSEQAIWAWMVKEGYVFKKGCRAKRMQQKRFLA